ncbi:MULTISPECIES: hypothetical protein [Rhizobium]|uniref:Lipoprotein n=1 Tax=Rhizobium tropici TaxID=398 RepID=A0A329YHB7_RHITR|nr:MULTISPECIES: hypothetical protein [Rhizobium]MBB3287670.1 hypothetical protein [Rhizobium sp. BK252]MBB3402726.1 hypothetical protein [Rhizobium sp. BK289]MBB3415302.1 hypothetical protein [Rhizobium sp. BK284]MBB3483191.1 hypothetical protein [Rhizobium sp. BK347]RAX42756.1 hypothetical protein DQ393_05080 [Rhizobium tropici]
MGLVRITLTVAGICLALSACNTTDALTPPEAIGDAGSSPVTQRDVERIAAAPQRRQTYQGSQESYGYQQQTSQQAYQPQNYGGGGTLDEQASALKSNGTNPYASRPLDGSRTASIAPANNQFSEADEQREADRRLLEDPPPPQQQQEQAADDQPPQQQASLPPAAAAGGNSIRFLPIIGAPVDAVTPLSRQLGADARALGLTIKSSSDSSAAYILKGYLSAFEDGPQISVTYVWDVLDGNGNRVHRIQGSESTPLKRGDPWSAVPPTVMQKIASKTMSEFNSWRDSNGG